MRPVSRALLLGGAAMAVLLIAKSGGATGGASVSRGRIFTDDLVGVRVVGAQVQPNYATFHASSEGALHRATFDTTAPGSGAGVLRLGVVRNLSDGGTGILCEVTIPCTSAGGTHIHPDAGTCDDAAISEGEHLKLSPIDDQCGNAPDGMFMATFRWQ